MFYQLRPFFFKSSQQFSLFCEYKNNVCLQNDFHPVFTLIRSQSQKQEMVSERVEVTRVVLEAKGRTSCNDWFRRVWRKKHPEQWHVNQSARGEVVKSIPKSCAWCKRVIFQENSTEQAESGRARERCKNVCIYGCTCICTCTSAALRNGRNSFLYAGVWILEEGSRSWWESPSSEAEVQQVLNKIFRI